MPYKDLLVKKQYHHEYFQKKKLILLEKRKGYNKEHRAEINQWAREYYKKKGKGKEI